MSVTCPKCHSRNPETIKFYWECGSRLSSLKDIHPEVAILVPFKGITME